MLISTVDSSLNAEGGNGARIRAPSAPRPAVDIVARLVSVDYGRLRQPIRTPRRMVVLQGDLFPPRRAFGKRLTQRAPWGAPAASSPSASPIGARVSRNVTFSQTRCKAPMPCRSWGGKTYFTGGLEPPEAGRCIARVQVVDLPGPGRQNVEPIFVFRLATNSRTRAKLNGGKLHIHAGDTGAEGAARLRRTHRTLPRFHGGGRHGRPRFISANTTTNTTTASCLLTKGTSLSNFFSFSDRVDRRLDGVLARGH